MTPGLESWEKIDASHFKAQQNGFERSPKELYKETLSRIITNIHLWNGPISKIFFIYIQNQINKESLLGIYPQISLEDLFTRTSSLYYWRGSPFLCLVFIVMFLLHSRLHVWWWWWWLIKTIWPRDIHGTLYVSKLCSVGIMMTLPNDEAI